MQVVTLFLCSIANLKGFFCLIDVPVHRIKFLLIILLLGIAQLTNAQDPFHFMLGEDALAGVEIYDIIEDNNKNYWIASDNGIIKYDGYTFKKIPSSGLLGNSVFEFKEAKNQLFCKNLSGQIIKISNDSAAVFFQIPDSLMTTDFNYLFDEKGTLHVFSNSFFKVLPNGKILRILSAQETASTASFYLTFKLPDGSIIMQKPGSKYIFVYKNNRISKRHVGFDIDRCYYHPFILKNHITFWNRETNQVITDGKNGFKLVPPNQFIKATDFGSRLYADKSTIWLLSPKNGAKVFNHNLVPHLQFENIFSSVFISCVHKDKEGNYLLGTFGSGIIVISNLNSLQLKLPNPNLKINKITSNGLDKLYVGTQSGEVYSVNTNNQFNFEDKSQEGNVRFLKYLLSQKKLVINSSITDIKSPAKKSTSPIIPGSVKDIEPIGNNLYIVSLNIGIKVFKFSADKFEDATPLFCPNFMERAYCANYNPLTKKIYAGTAKGLKIGDSTGSKYFTLNNQSLICNDIKWANNKMFVTTQEHGILVFENDKLVKNILIKNGLASNHTKQLKQYKKHLYVSMNNAFQILTLDGDVSYTLSKSDGISIHRIVDFEIMNDVLWIATQNDLQPIEINTLDEIAFVPKITISSVLVNETAIKNNSQSQTFDYITKQISFIVSSKSLKNKADIAYTYLLKGYEDEWHINPYAENNITYKSLPDGKYTFMVKAICGGKESPLLRYKFEITKPFWETWWFYSLIGGLLLLTTYLFYKNQLKKQLKETRLKNELMSTKLTAIKSQMNPHFIFNSLNSIQDLVLQQDAHNAYDYISKFAMLVRKILHHSDLDFVDFEEELKIIQLYIELEKLRFKKDFEFKIAANDIDDITIPPMLIQPYVENAIKHGLLHKKGLKQLEINFKLNEETVICEIIDNGIGIGQSKIINERQKKAHQSFTLKSMDHRFELLKETYKGALGASFTDLKAADGTSAGTKVTLTIPCKRKF